MFPVVSKQAWSLTLGDAVPAWVTVLLVMLSAVLSFVSSWLVHKREKRQIEQEGDHHDSEMVAQLQDTWLERHDSLMDGIADENRRLRERLDNLEKGFEDLEGERDRLRQMLSEVRDHRMQLRRRVMRLEQFAEQQRRHVVVMHDTLVEHVGEQASPIDEPIREPVHEHVDDEGA